MKNMPSPVKVCMHMNRDPRAVATLFFRSQGVTVSRKLTPSDVLDVLSLHKVSCRVINYYAFKEVNICIL